MLTAVCNNLKIIRAVFYWKPTWIYAKYDDDLGLNTMLGPDTGRAQHKGLPNTLHQADVILINFLINIGACIVSVLVFKPIMLNFIYDIRYVGMLIYTAVNFMKWMWWPIRMWVCRELMDDDLWSYARAVTIAMLFLCQFGAILGVTQVIDRL